MCWLINGVGGAYWDAPVLYLFSALQACISSVLISWTTDGVGVSVGGAHWEEVRAIDTCGVDVLVGGGRWEEV